MEEQIDPADHLNLVWYVVHRFKGVQDKDDAFQEGCLGLIRAAEKFNPERGVTFGSYARYWILAYLRNMRMRERCMVKLGTTQAQRHIFSRVGRAAEEVHRQSPEMAEETEEWYSAMADALDVELKVFRETYNRLRGWDSSLDTPVPGAESATLGDLQVAEGTDPTDEMNRQRVRTMLDRMMEGLSSRERDIIRLRFLRDETLTLEEIGGRYGVSRERIRQLEVRALKKLRVAVLHHPHVHELSDDETVPPLLREAV
jgi:RNA polymerase sigma-32 factor